MKTTATLIQQALEQKAIDSMIAYERNLISEQKMGKALNDALQHYGNVEGHPQHCPQRMDYKNDLRPEKQPTE